MCAWSVPVCAYTYTHTRVFFSLPKEIGVVAKQNHLSGFCLLNSSIMPRLSSCLMLQTSSRVMGMWETSMLHSGQESMMPLLLKHVQDHLQLSHISKVMPGKISPVILFWPALISSYGITRLSGDSDIPSC